MSEQDKTPETQGDIKGLKDKDKVVKLNEKLEGCLIDPTEKLDPPKRAWLMVDSNGEYILGTLGNFSLVTGKAKSKKSFFINIAVSATVSGQVTCNKFKSELPKEQQTVLYFDTEQGKYHVQLALKRICKQTGIAEPTNLKVYGLRSYKPSDRLKLIEYAIYNIPNIGLVVIDGIKDLINSINNEEEATMISSKLLKWTEEKNIHIINVLHQNKTSEHARGHIGTELINKSETVLSINVDDGDRQISVMTPEQTRNKEPQPFAFRINEQGLPIEVENYQFTKEISSGQRNFLTELTEKYKYEIIESCFVREAERQGIERIERFNVKITYGNLIEDVKYLTEDFHQEKVGNNKTKAFITHCKMKGYLSQEKARKPYQLLKFEVVDSLRITTSNF